MGALRKLLLAVLISNDRRVSMHQKGLFHGDDGTVWQSGNPIDVGDEKFSSSGALDSTGRPDSRDYRRRHGPSGLAGAMAALNEKGGEPVLCMWPRLDHHFADPPQMAIEAARGADRGKIVSVLRLEGIIEKITMIIDDTVVCDNGKILV